MFAEWWETLAQWLRLDVELTRRIVQTTLTLLVLLSLRWVGLRLVRKNVEDLRRHFYWRRAINYVAWVVGLLVVAQFWFEAVENLSVILGVASAGLAIAMKEPLLNFAGWIFILLRRPFVVGDRIEINHIIGDVIDVRLFQTYLLECGQWAGSDQSTGRTVVVPNMMIFIHPLSNYTHGFDHIWDEMNVLITFESDWRRAKQLLAEIGHTHARAFYEGAQHQIRRAASEHMIFFQKLTPTVYLTVREWGIQLTLRYLAPARRRRLCAQELWEAVLSSFGEEADIEFAYPTSRIAESPLARRLESQPPPPETGTDHPE